MIRAAIVALPAIFVLNILLHIFVDESAAASEDKLTFLIGFVLPLFVVFGLFMFIFMNILRWVDEEKEN